MKKLIEDHSIQSYHSFSLTATTKDLDVKLAEALNVLSLDLEGKLVRSLTIRGKFNFHLSILYAIS